MTNVNYNLQGSTIGNSAHQVQDQASQYAANFSQTIDQNWDEINRSIESLREMIKEFPDEQREEALVHLNDLQADISNPEKRKPQAMKMRIRGLLAIAGVLATAAVNVVDFTNNVSDLAEKLGFDKPQLVQVATASSSPSIDLASQGIGEAQAAILRANPVPFPDELDTPEMAIYDNYDEVRAAREAR